MKKSIENTKTRQKEINIKQAKGIYLSVLVVAVLIFVVGFYYVFNMDNNETNIIKEQDSLKAIIDTDGDGYLDENDADPENWDVGDRDLLMFATLAYEPANSDNLDKSTKIIKYGSNGKPLYDLKGNVQYTTVSQLKRANGKPGFDYVCPDAKRNDADGNCMIKEQQMIGMQAQSYNFFGGIVFKTWQEIGRDYYFAGLNNQNKIEYYASVDEVNQWAIVDYVSEPTRKVFNNNRMFEATTFRLDNNIVIAFRGTDFPDLLEWFADAGYIVNNILGYEKPAKEYAMKIIDRFVREYGDELKAAIENNTEMPKEPKFYFTGHSLGGYLSQIAALSIIKKKDSIIKIPLGDEFEIELDIKDYLEDIVYFNGMGLNFNLLMLEKHKKDYNALEKWIEKESAEKGKTHKIRCYNIKGDLISSLGKHVDQIEFYASEGAVKKHMQDSALLQVATRNLIIQKATSLVLNSAGIFTNGRLDKVGGYFDYYNNLYGKKQKISVLDLLWFAHEPSAGLFYNIKQGTRGNEETIKVTQSISKKTIFKTVIDFRAEVTGCVTQYKWYKNDIEIRGANSDTYQITRSIGKRLELSDKYSVEATIETNETNKKENKTKVLKQDISIDNKGPTGNVTSTTWQVKRKNTMQVKIVCQDENGFSDDVITKSDIGISGLIKNLTVESVSTPVITDEGETATWTVTLKGNRIGFASVILKEGSVADVYGNYNKAITSKLIKVTLL